MTDREYPEGHDTVLSKGPCPKCGSQDNLVTYDDGHSHCFTPGCGHHARGLEGDQADLGDDAGHGVSRRLPLAPIQHKEANGLLNPADYPGAFSELGKRRLRSDTLKRFGYFVGRYSSTAVHVSPYYGPQGELVAQKLRWPDKDFTVLKAEGYESIQKCQLFGRHVWGDRFDKKVVVTEGELDALSVAQAVDFKLPAVSVNGGAQSAAKCLKENYLWLDRFSEIILWLDDDEPGRQATEECAKLFKVGKVKVVRGTGFKDASDMLQADKPGDIYETIYAATAWRPKGLVNARDNPRDVMAPSEKGEAYSYPPCMPKLQEMTGGMHGGEVVYHVAGTGIGKSSALREIQWHLVEQGAKIAVLSFEDTVRDAKLGLMSVAESCRLGLLPVPDPTDLPGRKKYDDHMLAIHARVFGGGLVELFDPETAEWAMEAMLGYIRYAAKALDCWGIFVDPISFVAAGIDLAADERRVLDKVASEFAKLAKELGIHLEISHHLKRTQGIPHEEGAPTSLNELRSSGGLANFATCVVGWERNNQAEGDGWRVTRSRIIKPVRRTGKSGVADVIYYGENGRYTPSHLPFPPIGKPDEGSNTSTTSARGFSPIAGHQAVKDY